MTFLKNRAKVRSAFDTQDISNLEAQFSFGAVP